MRMKLLYTFLVWLSGLMAASVAEAVTVDGYVDGPKAAYLGGTYSVYADFMTTSAVYDFQLELYVYRNGSYLTSYGTITSNGIAEVDGYFEETASILGTVNYHFECYNVAIDWPVEIIYPQYVSLESVSPTVMLAGETKTVAVTLRNVGQGPWTVSGANGVVMCTWGSFINWSEVPIVNTVQPGQTITLNATFQAPNQTGIGYQSIGLYNYDAWRWLNNDNIFTIPIRVVAVNGDEDGDGMTNAWELAHGLNPLVNDANLDPDGDGLTNFQEYQMGRDPQMSDNPVGLAVFTPAR